MTKIGLFQIDLHFGDPVRNREKVAALFEKLAGQNYDLVLLPELWTTGYDLTRLDEISEKNGETTLPFLSSLAVQYNVNIIGGSIANEVDGDVFNTLPVIDRKGKIVHSYSKLHLFKLMDEHLHLQAGKDESIFELEDDTFASFICYDLRFPEWVRKPVLAGAKALFFVAEWPQPRIDHWITLLKARAIENQSYVIACNRVGRDPENVFGGNSIVIDPWGEVIAQGSDREELLTAEIDLKNVDEIRKRIPVFDDRRPSFYSKM